MSSAELLSLSVRGLGVISDVTLDFAPGFTVITGETGAGKTLLVDALTLCVGGESRTPQRGDELEVSAVFRQDSVGEVCLQRSVTSSQRLKSFIDGAPTSSESLRVRSQDLLIIHGQHDSLRLKNRAEVLAMLDRFSGIDTSELDRLRAERQRLIDEQVELGGDRSERSRQLEFARFQIDEINRAALTTDTEIEEVLERLESLTEIEDQVQAINRVGVSLESEGGLDDFAMAVSALGTHGEIGLLRERILEAIRAIRSDTGSLLNLIDPERVDSAEIDVLNRRVDTLRTLARKYGGSLSDVIHAKRDAESLVERLTGAEEKSEIIRTLLVEYEESIRRESSRIRNLRESGGHRFTGEVNGYMSRVALPNARIEVLVSGDDGSDVELHFVPNPGAKGGPIQQIGSGGELSRVLLAVSLVTGESGKVTVFDEVDSGIGGNVAQSIGQCLRDLAAEQQVIAVTHLASVAAQADHHFVVEKHVIGESTRTIVRAVSGSERVSEIARMLAGDGATTESRALAERLLQR